MNVSDIIAGLLIIIATGLGAIVALRRKDADISDADRAGTPDIPPATPSPALSTITTTIAPAPNPAPSAYQLRQIEMVARTIWGEARGESEEGQYAVGFVIRNRVFSDRYPDEYEQVVLQRKQFSVWDALDSPGVPQRLRSLTENDAGYSQAYRIAQEIVSQRVSTPSRFVGVLHYLNPDLRLYPSGQLPSWTRAATDSFDIGNHRFYKGVA